MPVPMKLTDDEYDIGAQVLEEGPTEWEMPDLPPLEDEAGADRLLRARARVAAELARVDARYDELVAQLDAWHRDLAAGLAAQVNHIDATLADWFRAQDGRHKPIKLPHGTIASRKGSMRMVETDAAAFRAWAAENLADALMPQEPKIVKAVVRDAAKIDPKFGELYGADDAVVITADGEVVPGVRWETDGRTIGVKQ